jgi:eukaryotic-like serine/threonine-protein kinase
MAWARLGVLYLNSGQTGKAMEYFNRAHELSGDVSERERLYIEGHYYTEVLGDLDKAIETLQVAIQEYPLQVDNYINLGVLYGSKGELEKAQTLLLRGMAVQPDEAVGLADLVAGYLAMDQPAKAREYVAKERALGMNGTDLVQYELALDGATGDEAGSKKMMAEAVGHPDRFQVTGQLGNNQAQWGQFKSATATLQQAAEQAGEAKAGDAQAEYLMNAAYIGWPVEQCQNADAAVKKALALDKTKPTQIAAAVTHALCGQGKLALAELDVLEKKYPDDTLVQQMFVPQARAFVALQAGEARKAVDLLAKSEGFDLVSPGPYLRGLAYLKLNDAGNAIAAFKSATRFKGSTYLNENANPFPMNNYGASLLGLARAYGMAGDKVNAKAAYQKFFVEWKNADPDLAVIAEAKKEYAAL